VVAAQSTTRTGPMTPPFPVLFPVLSEHLPPLDPEDGPPTYALSDLLQTPLTRRERWLMPLAFAVGLPLLAGTAYVWGQVFGAW